MAPLRHAVRLVDGEQGNARFAQQFQHARHHQPFGRDIQQIEFAVAQAPLHGVGLLTIQGGVQKRRTHTQLFERRDLILHQRDQGRHHQRRALAQQRRELITQGFAAAGGHQHQRVAALGDVTDDLLLCAAKRGMAEDGGEQF